MDVEVRCPVCHRRERWAADGSTEVVTEGGGRRAPGSPIRAAFDRLRAVATNDGDEGVVGTCACGLPLVGGREAVGHPRAEAFELTLPMGALVVQGTTATMAGEAVDWDAVTRAVHANFPDDDPDDRGVFERLFAGGLLTAMMLPAALWCIAVFVVIVFYRQWATYGVPGGP